MTLDRPPYKEALVDPSTGLISTAWMRFIDQITEAAQESQMPSVLGPYSSASNYSSDILGDDDSRPGTWGKAGSSEEIIQFNPPANYRTRILRVYGNFIGFPKAVTPTPVPDDVYAGVLFGLLSTAGDGSARMVPAADNCSLYVQGSVSAKNTTFETQFDYATNYGGLLEADNKLRVRLAVFLNTTGLEIHMETSFVTVYQFEPIG